ncbi:thermonuclease family protein [Rhizobium sp. NXC24]|uniref:thermonuclease family protein n=1 Tax=Rhizobium sp. NXC24 TaxID=2048897 RepID=UPI000CDF34F6|nr:thermonuclease family protein [Rhizobium sp. NXC24]AVA23842.1 nuclease SNase-like protein [Rhizobium sp. NXC24]
MKKPGFLAAGILAAFLASAPARAEDKPNPWFQVPATASFTTGDTWTYAGETHRLYGVQACLRGTYFTNGAGAPVDCGEASLAMLVSLIRDLKPECYTAAWQAATKTRFVICVAQPTSGSAAGSRIDLGTALISTGWAFAAVTPNGAPVHDPYIVAQDVAKKQRLGLWQFSDVPDPNVIILRDIRNAANAPAQASIPPANQ